jgi:hypothetical protein
MPCEYEFSKYVYVPQSTKDEREIARIPSANAAAALEPLLAGLNPLQELALHSRISCGGAYRHVPMLDLAERFSEAHLQALRGLMAEFEVGEFAVYHSGRSAHVYGLALLSDDRLRQFFARALLLNLPGKEPLVDSRWIGHRLYAGYGSLRWSCNTKQYLNWPKTIGVFKAK